MLLLGAWCVPSLASTDIQAPCPELGTTTDASLHEVLSDEDVTMPTIRRTDTSDVVRLPAVAATKVESDYKDHDVSSDLEDTALRNSKTAAIVTRLPGVSASDQPRFRRNMFRTDI